MKSFFSKYLRGNPSPTKGDNPEDILASGENEM
jgi:hypothetical protein